MIWLIIRWFRLRAWIDFALRVDGGAGRSISLRYPRYLMGEASLLDIWGALPCHHLLWQRKQKIIILVKLETENQFTLLDIFIGQRGDSSDKPKTSGEALRWVAQFSG